MTAPAAWLPASRAAWLTAALLAAGVVVAAACGGPRGGDTGTARRAVVGIVTSVQGTSPTDVSEFTLRTPEGEIVSFRVGQVELGGDAFPAGHLREHQANAEPVRVTYLERDGGNDAVRLEDAR